MDEKRVILSASEWRVMECLWTGPKTLMELVRALKDSAGWEDAAAAETDSLLERAFQGSVGLLVSSLADRGTLSKADIDELYDILDRAEGEAK